MEMRFLKKLNIFLPIFSVILRTKIFLSTHFWSLSNLVSENRVRFEGSIKKNFSLSVEIRRKMTFAISNFKIFEKFEFLHNHEELNIGNGIATFSERSSFRQANNFFNLTQFKIIDFLISADLT